MKTGIIKMIQPNGGYDTTVNGNAMHINTNMMTIEVAGEGQITGEIGSKTTPYPMNVDDEITVEIKNTQHGVKFKKVNPQYAQGGSQGGGQVNPTASSIVQDRPIGSKDEMICRQTAGKVAGEVVAAMITSGWFEVNDTIEIEGKLLEISDIMSIWFIEGRTKKPGEDELGF